jgi:hypothetical protein
MLYSPESLSALWRQERPPRVMRAVIQFVEDQSLAGKAVELHEENVTFTEQLMYIDDDIKHPKNKMEPLLQESRMIFCSRSSQK